MLNGSGDIKYEGAGFIRGVPEGSSPPHATLSRTLQARAVIPENRGQRTELLHESLREAEFKAGDLSKQDCLPSASGPSSQSSEEKGLLWGRGGERKRERKEAEEGEERGEERRRG